jgi:CRISPR-associated protein Cas1
LNPAILDGWGIKVKVQGSMLELTNGKLDQRLPTSMRFTPRRCPFDSVVIDGFSGYVSLRALHWLGKNQIPLHVLDYDGTLLSSTLPKQPIKSDVRLAQYQAVNDPKKKHAIAKALIEAKLARSLQVLTRLSERYDVEMELRAAKLEASRLRKATTVSEIRTTEGRVALRYWQAIRKILPERLDFRTRSTTTHQNNASDCVNVSLNYVYSILESEVRRAVNSTGMESSVGFLHEFSATQTRESLVYDLQEPFRWFADLCVIEGFERGILDKEDFYFTFADLRYRFNEEPKLRFVDLIRERFNSTVRYKGRMLRWDTVIFEKTNELARYLTGKSKALAFMEPSPTLERFDNMDLRERIKALTSEDAKKLGIDKSTLYTLRQHVRKEPPFKLCRKTLEKLQSTRG